PLFAQRKVEQGSAQRAAEVRPTLAPIQAGIGESSTRRARAVDIQPEALERHRTLGREQIRIARAAPVVGDPAERHEPVVQRDAERTGDVVVAGARGDQVIGRARNELHRGTPDNRAQGLEHVRDFAAAEAVVAMLSLRGGAHQARRLKTAEVCTRGRCAHPGGQRELGGGAGPAVEEGEEHSRTGRFADRGGDGGRGVVGVSSGIGRHTSTLDEVCVRRKLVRGSTVARHPPRRSSTFARRNGKAKKNVEPSSGNSAHARPPTDSTMSFTMLRPSPVPSAPVTVWCARKNRSKRPARLSGGTPRPLSLTQTITSATASWPLISAYESLAPGTVYLIELVR